MKTIWLGFTFLISVINLQAQSNYSKEISRINKDRLSLKKNNTKLDSVKQYLLRQYNSVVFPYWVGTSWDYNGYTNVPRQSTIACGYFVSTSLKHIGFNWNRFELAKMYSKDMVNSVCDSVYKFDTKQELHTYIRYRPDNLYIIGLSGHVGLILKYQKELWFIHSDYHNRVGPIKEKIELSQALNESDVFWCGTFLTKKNLNKWLNKTRYGKK